jgi:hypothetical protein
MRVAMVNHKFVMRSARRDNNIRKRRSDARAAAGGAELEGLPPNFFRNLKRHRRQMNFFDCFPFVVIANTVPKFCCDNGTNSGISLGDEFLDLREIFGSLLRRK